MLSFFTLLVVLFSFAYAEEYTVSIPFGAYNPELNTPADAWYAPAFLPIEVGDTVIWQNNDREPHTVTSGQGSGRFGWMSDDYGTPNGLFDSDLFAPGESWSHTFSEKGTFSYFCIIHPWMEGAIIVNPKIPDHPVDGFGNKIEEFPIIAYTTDGVVEIDMTWEPNIIKTNERVVFIYHTYDPATNTNLDKMSYDIIIKQNGKEIFRDEGLTNVGGDYRNFLFEEPGPIEIIFENVVSWGTSGIESEARNQPLHPSLRSVQFSTIVFENTDNEFVLPKIIQPKQTFQLYYEVAVAIIVIPAALLIIVIILMIRGKPLSKYHNQKSSPI